jgi:DNA-binding NarL/FixJ family response regulator
VLALTKEIRIAIVDGDDDIRAGRKAIIESVADLKIVLEEDNAIRALERIPDALVDVMIIDQRLQAQDGAWLVEKIRGALGLDEALAAKIIMTAPYFSDELLIAAIRAGANDLVTQDLGPDQLLEAIFRAANKDSDFEPDALLRKFVELKLPASDSTVFLVRLGDLSEREREIIRMLLHGVSEFEIAKRIDAPKYRVKQILDDMQKRTLISTRTQLLLALYEAEGRLAL